MRLYTRLLPTIALGATLLAIIFLFKRPLAFTILLPDGVHVYLERSEALSSPERPDVLPPSRPPLRAPPPSPPASFASVDDDTAVPVRVPDKDSTNQITDSVRTAITSFTDYGPAAASIIGRKRARFDKLPASQRKVAEALGYTKHFSSAKQGARVNQQFAARVAEHAREVYGLDGYSEAEGKADYGLVDLAFGHMARDWSDKGRAERDQVFPPIFEALEHAFPKGNGRKRVLVPGSGLGRLAHEIASLPQFTVDACERDHGAVFLYRYLLFNTTVPLQHTLHPFVNKWTHQMNPTARFQAVQFPDMLPSANAVTLVEGDFLTEFPDEAVYDAIVTLFFIDVSESIIDFLEQIHRLLKPGGLWINLGPFKWGSYARLQLSAEEVLQLADMIGFDIDRASRKSIETVYTYQPETLLKFTYVTQFWTARKRL